MSVVELRSLIEIIMRFFLPDDQQISNEGWFYRLRSKKSYGILWLPQKVLTKNTKKAQIRNLWEKLIEDTSIWNMTKKYHCSCI